MTEHVGVGRPRDPSVDEKVTLAAVELFGDAGWSGFTIDEVARRAGVGKAAIYRRWANKDSLLADALSRTLNVATADTGSLRGDLIAAAVQLMYSFTGPTGRAFRRLSVEADAVDAVAPNFEAWRRDQFAAARDIMRRGVERGELPADAPIPIIMNAIYGGAINQVSSAPKDRMGAVRENIDEYVPRLVDFILGGVSAGVSGN